MVKTVLHLKLYLHVLTRLYRLSPTAPILFLSPFHFSLLPNLHPLLTFPDRVHSVDRFHSETYSDSLSQNDVRLL